MRFDSNDEDSADWRLLIGDSIRLGYQARVAECLAGKATVSGPDENCRFSAYTLFCLPEWIASDEFDVIQWNNGQWDTCYMADGKSDTPLPLYLELRKRIATILQKKTKRLIFATTTPVWAGQFNNAQSNPRKNEDICEYNRAVVDTLHPMGVEINHLHAAVAENVRRYISGDMVHLTEDGIDLCARLVAQEMVG